MPIERFYDDLAPYYRLIYDDWDAGSRRQAAMLDGIIRRFGAIDVRPPECTVLDAACGIGTQSIGLAELGYQVTGSDISPEAVELARHEAKERGLQIDLRVADMRNLWAAHGREFDVVLAYDNAIPHLAGEVEVLTACEQFYRCARPGGLCLLSLRDYAAMQRGVPGEVQVMPRLAHDTPAGRVVLCDTWEFGEDFYEITIYVIMDDGRPSAEARIIRGGRYYWVTTDTVERLLAQAGFGQVQTLRGSRYQPIVLGIK
jgi:SAM-dependent methyltransferase